MMACVGLVRFFPIDDFWEPLVFFAAAMAEILTGLCRLERIFKMDTGWVVENTRGGFVQNVVFLRKTRFADIVDKPARIP